MIEIRRRNHPGQRYSIDYAYHENARCTVIRASAEVLKVERDCTEYRVRLDALEHFDASGVLLDHFEGIFYQVIDDDGSLTAKDIKRPRGFARWQAENENGNLVQLMGDRAQPPRNPVAVGEAWPPQLHGWRLLSLENGFAHAVQFLEQPGQGLERLECDTLVALADGFTGRRTCSEHISSGVVLKYSLDIRLT